MQITRYGVCRLNFPATEKFDEVFVDHDDCNDDNGRYVNVTEFIF